MNPPPSIDLPFFAYGAFKPGQLAYHRLADLVLTSTAASVKGQLFVRDGLPIAAIGPPFENRQIPGFLLRFKEEAAGEAYRRILELEPQDQCSWKQVLAGATAANVLAALSPEKGGVSLDEEWDGATDPLFTTALDVVQDALAANREFNWDLRPMFRLQMGYLLLWSAIERYVSLRYHLGGRVMQKVNQLATEPAFCAALLEINPEPRKLFSAESPDRPIVLRADKPKRAIEYYYQVRSNACHRGKAATRDHDRFLQSLGELLKIFRAVLRAAFSGRIGKTTSDRG